jgi:uncharacterized protein (DUF2267 family)
LPHSFRTNADAGMPMPERFSSAEFLLRVCAREGIDLSASTDHARAVIDVLTRAVSPGEIVEVFDRLPDDYRRLFPNSEGPMLRQ